MAALMVSAGPSGSWDKEPQDEPRIDSEHFQYPGIEAGFCMQKYRLREAMLAKHLGSTFHLAPGFPRRVDSPAVWSSTTLDPDDITYHASLDDVDEIEMALQRFKESSHGLNDIAPKTFSLPNLGPKLRALSFEIHEGKCAAIIKGLNPDKYCLEDNMVIFAGLASYIGDQRGRQSSQNDVLTHLYSTQDKTVVDPRPGLSNHGLPFHNDHCDILALYVMETAAAGGTTRWASFGQIYNEIVRTKPQVVEILARNDWPHETPSRVIKNLPLMFTDSKGTPFVSFTRFALTGLPTYPRRSETPQLTPEQADALDTIQYLASQYAVEVTQEKGDIFLINNRTVLHARDRIHDSLSGTRRHLMRLCLRDTEYGHPIPSDLKRRWGDIFDNNQHKFGKWMMKKEADPTFVSNSKFDSSFMNDETQGSHG